MIIASISLELNVGVLERASTEFFVGYNIVGHAHCPLHVARLVLDHGGEVSNLLLLSSFGGCLIGFLFVASLLIRNIIDKVLLHSGFGHGVGQFLSLSLLLLIGLDEIGLLSSQNFLLCGGNL